MTLDQYLVKNDISTAAFAELIGAAFETVRRYRHGERIPEPEYMARIYDATGGDVAANDFYGIGKKQGGKRNA